MINDEAKNLIKSFYSFCKARDIGFFEFWKFFFKGLLVRLKARKRR